MTKDVRSFVAVPLPGEVRARVLAATEELARELPAVKWTRKLENLHVTIKFLGPVSEEKLAALGPAFEAALGSLPVFEIAVAGMGAFPSARRANVVWAGVDDPSGGLERAAAIVEAVAARAGVGEPAARPFRAHVTVGRSKTPVEAAAPLGRLGRRAFGSATVGALHLYESRLGGGPENAGSTYLLRHTAALASKASN